MSRVPLVAALAAFALVLGLRATSPHIPGIPLTSIPVGVTVQEVEGTRVFLVKEGSARVRAFLQRSPQGDRLVWCPREDIFVSPRKAELFDRQGQLVDGPAKRGMFEVDLQVTQDERVIIRPDRLKPPPGGKGSVPGTAGQIYDRWRANPRANIGFCLDPVG